MTDSWWKGPYWTLCPRTGPEERENQAEGITQLLGLSAPIAILDVACWDGGLSIALASRGHAVTALDIEDAFLRAGRQLARLREVHVDWVRGDMRTLPFDGGFDLVLCFCWAFGFFDDDGNRAFLASAYRALRPGGRLLLDTQAVETTLPRWRDRKWHRLKADHHILEETTWDAATGRINTEFIVFEGSAAPRSASSSYRLYSYRELAGMCEDVGFVRVIGLAGSLSDSFETGGIVKRSFHLGAERLVLLAKK